jgi:hypothetical protein
VEEMVKGCRWFKLLVRGRGGGMVDNMVIDWVVCHGDVTEKMTTRAEERRGRRGSKQEGHLNSFLQW